MAETEIPAPTPIAPLRAQGLTERGEARLLDVRPIASFLAGHARGSRNVPYAAADFHAIVAQLVSPGPPAVLVAEDSGTAAAAAAGLRAAGHRVAGSLDGGFAAWWKAGLPTRRMEELDAPAVAEMLARGGPRVIDVRQPGEWAAGTIAGALRLPLPTLADRLDELDRDHHYVTVCGHGRRSRQAAWLMLQRGFAEVTSLEGGMAAWQEAGLPTEG